MTRAPSPLISLASMAVGLAGLIVLIAYVAICIHVGDPWPWMAAVHEDGERTLLDTLLYYEHATRELPQDLLLGLAIGACVYAAFPASSPEAARTGGSRALLGLLFICGFILVGAYIKIGPQALVENLLQHHTRPGAPLVWGSHWRYHLLERGPLIAAGLGIAAFLQSGLTARGGGRLERRGVWGVGIVIAAYLAATAVFTPTLADLALPFVDPQYLGHEIREIMTHAIVTLPIGWGGCVLLQQAAMPQTELRGVRDWIGGLVRGLPWIGLAAAAWTFVLVAALRSDSASHGQTSDWITLIFPHFFEHGFTYLVVPLAAAFAYGCCASANAGGRLA